MHGASHSASQLPLALLGSGGGILKQDAHVEFATAPDDPQLRDVYHTVLSSCFDVDAPFGDDHRGNANVILSNMLRS
jgi:hypothetical protein